MTKPTETKKKKCQHDYIRVRTFVNKLGFTVATYKCKICDGEVDAKTLPRNK